MYRKCPCCGANLDPCERCDCQDSEDNGNKKAAMPASTAADPQKRRPDMTAILYHNSPHLSTQKVVAHYG